MKQWTIDKKLIASFLAVAFAASAVAAGAGPNITADEALTKLKDGNARYASNKSIHPNQDAARRSTVVQGQTPFVTVLSCADSRVPVELLFDQGIGDTFVARVAGNVSDTDEVGTIEYGVGHLNTPLLVVLGHTGCGAVKAVLEGAQLHGSIPALVDNITPAITQARAANPSAGATALLGEAVNANVWVSIDDLFKRSSEVRELVKTGKLKVVGAVYSLESGGVNWLGAHPEQARLLAYTGGAGAEGTHGTAEATGVAHSAGDAASASTATEHGAVASHAATASNQAQDAAAGGSSLGLILLSLSIAAGLLVLAGGTFYVTRQSPLKTRILANSALLLVLLLGASGFAWYEFQKIGQELNSIAKDNLPILNNFADVEARMLTQSLALEKFASSGNTRFVTEFDLEGAEVEKELEAVKTEIGRALKNAVNDQDRRDYQKMLEQVNGLKKEHGDFDRNGDEYVTAMKAGQRQKAAQLKDLIEREGHQMHSAATNLVNEVQAETQHQALMAQSAKHEGEIMLLVFSLVSLLIGISFAFFAARDITARLRAISNNLSSGAEQTASAAGQVSSASQSLAEGASEQAASLEETSSSLEEMSSVTKRNAESAQKVNELGKQARVAADNGANDMQAMSKAMDDIKVSSDEIAKIIKTIDEIAFQTNILALNAAVEAARAGEAGMGFAVVADEVRSLAQRSARAAKETADKIEGAITKTAQGVTISGKVAQGLQEIVGKARQVDELAAEVAAASREQSQGIDQVNSAVGQMDKVTQSNAASAEESASAAEELNAQADALKEAVSDLLMLVDGKGLDTQSSKPKARQQRTEVAGQPQREAPVTKRPSSNGHSHKLVQPRDTGASVMAANGKKSSEIPMEGDFKNF